MKKAPVFVFAVVLFFVNTVSCNSQSGILPSQAVKVLEAYIHCIGSGLKDLDKLAVGKAVESGQFLDMIITADTANELKPGLLNYKFVEAETTVKNADAASLSFTIILWGDPYNIEMIKEGNTWKVSDFSFIFKWS